MLWDSKCRSGPDGASDCPCTRASPSVTTPSMTDDTLQTARRRLDHIATTIETVTEHLDDEADSRALTQVLGSLEQVEADLNELNDETPSEELVEANNG